MVKNMRRLLAERRKFRTSSDFNLLLEEGWINGIGDCELLSTLIKRCIKEKGLVYTNTLLGSNKVVLDRLNSVDRELAYKVRSGKLLGEFIILEKELIHETSSILTGIISHIGEVLGTGVCCIEEDDGDILLKYKIGEVDLTYCLGDEEGGILDSLLEDTVGSLLDCIPISIKRLYFPIREKISEGYMYSSEEEGSYVIHLE